MIISFDASSIFKSILKDTAAAVTMIRDLIEYCFQQRIELEHKNREECNQLLTQRGFYKKSEASEEVPEEYRQGPYKLKEEL